MSESESVIKKSLELIEETADSELAEIIPYFEKAYKAYQWVKGLRMKRFLKSLGKAAEYLTESERKRLDQIISSKKGSELLAEYADSVLRTSSKTAITALALLYADLDDERYSPDFKRRASISLDGISDHQVDFYLELLVAHDRLDDNQKSGSDRAYSLSNISEIEQHHPEIDRLEDSYEGKIALINDLTRRGMLLPKYGLRLPVLSGDEDERSPMFEFGIPQWSYKLADLLHKAKEYRISI